MTLGSITLRGDPLLQSKESITYGGGIGGVGRFVYDSGRYIDYFLTTSRAESLDYEDNIDTIAARACSKNHLKSWWYLDFCLLGYQEEKTLSESEIRQLDLSLLKLISSSQYRHHEISVTPKYLISENYEQEQIELALETLHQSGAITEFSVLIGNNVDGEVATDAQFSFSLSKKISQHPAQLKFVQKKSTDAELLGFDRIDRSRYIGFSIKITPRIEIELGYSVTESTINYFDSNEFIGAINFSPFTL